MFTRLFRMAAALGIVAAGCLAMAASPSQAGGPATGPAADSVTITGVPVGWYRIRNANRPGECMQANPATAPNFGTLMGMWPCNDSVQQRWFFGSANPTFPPDFREVRNGTGTCLDADNRGGRLTRVIHLYQCNKSPNQAWAFSDPPGQGVVCVWVAYLCDLVLGQAPQTFPGLGYRINLENKTGNANQTFSLEPIA